MTNIHLLVIIHGMWGNPGHIAELARVACETHSVASSDGTVLHVLKAKSIRDNSTYDGVDWGGERVAKEARPSLQSWRELDVTNRDLQKVAETVEEFESKGDRVTRFSVTGYSLGGLVARYLIGWGLPLFVYDSEGSHPRIAAFYTIKVSSNTLHLSTLMPLLRHMLGCLAILLSFPLFQPFLDPSFFRERASSSFVSINGLQKGAPCSL